MVKISSLSPARIFLILLLIVCILMALDYLSPVLLPFVVAWLLAYMLNPIVNFFQHTCRLRFRLPCVLLTIVLTTGVLALLGWLIVPPLLDECGHLERVWAGYLENQGRNASIPQSFSEMFQRVVEYPEVKRFLRGGSLFATLKSVVPSLWDVLMGAASTIINIGASMIALLYLFFLMLDFDRYAKGWIKFIPVHRRATAQRMMADFEKYFCGYFRGQFLIALSNCVMFTIGFLLIGFPMPVGLGVFIGVISFVPYLQVVGIVPALILALLRATETGDNFWLLMGGVLLVYIVVQIIQDILVTPHVMGKIMGLSPAIILLALSVGGYLLGILGLILALPVTTLLLLYYKQYFVEEHPALE